MRFSAAYRATFPRHGALTHGTCPRAKTTPHDQCPKQKMTAVRKPARSSKSHFEQRGGDFPSQQHTSWRSTINYKSISLHPNDLSREKRFLSELCYSINFIHQRVKTTQRVGEGQEREKGRRGWLRLEVSCLSNKARLLFPSDSITQVEHLIIFSYETTSVQTNRPTSGCRFRPTFV